MEAVECSPLFDHSCLLVYDYKSVTNEAHGNLGDLEDLFL